MNDNKYNMNTNFNISKKFQSVKCTETLPHFFLQNQVLCRTWMDRIFRAVEERKLCLKNVICKG